MTSSQQLAAAIKPGQRREHIRRRQGGIRRVHPVLGSGLRRQRDSCQYGRARAHPRHRRGTRGDSLEQLGSATPLGRTADPTEIAEAIVSLRRHKLATSPARPWRWTAATPRSDQVLARVWRPRLMSPGARPTRVAASTPVPSRRSRGPGRFRCRGKAGGFVRRTGQGVLST